MEEFKNLLKWQYIIPCILFIFSMYAWYLNTNSQIKELTNQQDIISKELDELKLNENTKFTRYDIDMAVVKQDNSYIKNTQDVIIRKLDDYTYKKN